MDPKINTDSEHLFLPDFCDIRVLFIVLIMAQLLAFLLSLAGSADFFNDFSDLAMTSLFTQWVSLSCLAILCVSRRFLCRLAETYAALAAFLLILLVALVISEVAWLLLHRQSLPFQFSAISYTNFMLRNLAITALVGAVTLRYLYVQYQWRQQLQAETRARIQALQSRIRPHFLFNCMNTIASLTRTSPAQAEQAIEDLSDLFRASLGEATQRISLREELQVCRQYLRIEGLRLDQRLQTEWAVETLPEDALIPALTIQPLLENAIYHGIEPLADGGRIHIRGTLEGDLCRLCIENPVPVTGATLNPQGNQLAQDNVQQRLTAYHGERGQLSIHVDAAQGVYRVCVAFPYERADDADSDRR